MAAPLLGLLAIFGICVLTRTPLASLPSRLLQLRDQLLHRTPEQDADDTELEIDLRDNVPPAKRTRGASRSRVGVFSTR